MDFLLHFLLLQAVNQAVQRKNACKDHSPCWAWTAPLYQGRKVNYMIVSPLLRKHLMLFHTNVVLIYVMLFFLLWLSDWANAILFLLKSSTQHLLLIQKSDIRGCIQLQDNCLHVHMMLYKFLHRKETQKNTSSFHLIIW